MGATGLAGVAGGTKSMPFHSRNVYPSLAAPAGFDLAIAPGSAGASWSHGF